MRRHPSKLERGGAVVRQRWFSKSMSLLVESLDARERRAALQHKVSWVLWDAVRAHAPLSARTAKRTHRFPQNAS